MEKILEGLIQKNRHLIQKGHVANYIPALSKVNPNYIGLAIADVDGHIYCAGDYNIKFSIQSISKIISLMLALIDNGEDYVFSKVGYEPTDEPFNTLYKLDLNSCNPANPMINSGAIITTSLIRGNKDEKFDRIIEFIRLITENPNIGYNEEVYSSEKATGHKNRAIAYLMKAKGYLDGEVEDILDVYFKQCSVEVTAVDVAKIGLFIARRCPLNLDSKINNERLASIVTAIITTCGMYDFSGEYAAKVGIPSKSGVGGGILGTIPNKLGIGVFNPALDRFGNNIAGYGIMKDLARELNLNIF